MIVRNHRSSVLIDCYGLEDMVMSQISIYTTTWCPYCIMAKNLLSSLDVDWKEVNIEREGISRADLEQLTGNFTVPQIIIGGKPIGGYDNLYALKQSGQLDELLTG